MINFDHVSVVYPESTEPTIKDVNLTVAPGEWLVLAGPTGTGKSTLLNSINGLVPRFTGGTLHGKVTVDGRDTSQLPPRELSDVVGVVNQDPLLGFVTDNVEAELAFGMEQLGLSPSTMRQRVEATIDLLGLAEIRDRKLSQLSGGQQQRVAIGSVFTSHPKVLVLDEPTSALDPTSAEEVLAALSRMVHDLGVTVVMAEHRLERVVQFADRVALMSADGRVTSGPPAEMMKSSPVVPPVVMLGRAMGWDPLPLSVRDARRDATGLVQELIGKQPNSSVPEHGPKPVLRARKVVVAYDELIAVNQVDLDLYGGEIVALMGRNGCGKSSLLWALQGTGAMRSGSVELGGNARAKATGKRGLFKRKSKESLGLDLGVGLVPQTPADLLFRDSVDKECEQADSDNGMPAGSTRAILDQIAPGVPHVTHPRDLSEGQKLSLALAITLVAKPDVLLLDEPTRGLDYEAKARLSELLDQLRDEGIAVVLSTHDVEFVALTCSRVIMMAGGEVIADDVATEVLTALPAFAPQVSRILNDGKWLTVDQVTEAVADTEGGDGHEG